MAVLCQSKWQHKHWPFITVSPESVCFYSDSGEFLIRFIHIIPKNLFLFSSTEILVEFCLILLLSTGNPPFLSQLSTFCGYLIYIQWMMLWINQYNDVFILLVHNIAFWHSKILFECLILWCQHYIMVWHTKTFQNLFFPVVTGK